MFSRRKNRPLELSTDGSNYSPSPNPNSLRPQAATGQTKPNPTPEVDPDAAGNSTPQQQLHPIQQLANTYNETGRPLPKIQRSKPPKPKTAAPTIINNYYYVQQPPVPPDASQMMSPLKQYNHSAVPSPVQRKMNRKPPMPGSTSPIHKEEDHHERGQQQQHQRHSSNSRTKFADDDRTQFGLSAISKRSGSGLTHRSDRMSSSSSSSLASSGYDDDGRYNSFVTKSTNISQRRSPKKDPIVSFYGENKNDIYSSTSIPTSDSRRKHHNYNNNDNSVDCTASAIAAKLPNINVDADYELAEDFDNLVIQFNKNLVLELVSLEDSQISVHDDRFFKLFNNISSGGSITLEQLGATLYDPYNNKNRFSFKTLNVIMNTFASKSTETYELNFRCFVKMCTFIKGCFVSFNYHDKRGSDHVLDFQEFRRALSTNNMACSDSLLARIFQTSGAVDFEHYIVAIILIRKEEKVH